MTEPTRIIIKASGRPEDFDRHKLLESLAASGASSKAAQDIADRVMADTPRTVTAKHLFRTARKYLRRLDTVSGMRYSIKKAIYDLGPSGYPFEHYVARVLAAYGYTVEVGTIMQGHCVRHEVDVIARKDREWNMVECKFHHNGSTASDVKVALYVYSRFLDLKSAVEAVSAGRDLVCRGWVVTNTRFTSDAVKFAECMGLKAVGWKHPRGASLERMIEDRRIYPVTILPAASRRALDLLLRKDLILAADLAEMTGKELSEETGIDPDTAERLTLQAVGLCG